MSIVNKSMDDDRPYDDWEPSQSIEAFLVGLDETLRGAYCLDFTTTKKLGESGFVIYHQRKRFHTRLMLELQRISLQRNSNVIRWRTTCTSLLGEREILGEFGAPNVTT